MKTSTTPSPPPTFNALNDQQASDEELMAAIQQQNATALEILIRRYRRLIKCAILRVVTDDAGAEDVVQESLLEVWRQARHYDPGKGRPLAWIMTLGKRRAIDHLRRSMAYGRAVDRMELSIQHLVPSPHDSAAACEQADMARVLNQHLTLLPDAQKRVIELAFLRGMSQREVAAATQTPLGTVKTRLELGLKRLRQVFRTRNAIHTLQAA